VNKLATAIGFRSLEMLQKFSSLWLRYITSFL